jgi:hypothetical protein
MFESCAGFTLRVQVKHEEDYLPIGPGDRSVPRIV